MDISYFSHEDRRGQTESTEQAIEEVYRYIYSDNPANRIRIAAKKLKSYASPQQHPFFEKIREMNKTHGGVQLDGENARCDEVFSEYVLKIANYCNSFYFWKLLKFVTLFRECVNIINKDKVKNELRDYTEIYNCEDVPDVSNEFITEFLDTDSKCFDITKEQAIDLTQNLCHWLYENNFTCSKLSLISNY